jgi:hypothetical protein
MKIDNFFAQLKRRNVVRMAGLYLVGAWLLVQGGGLLLIELHSGGAITVDDIRATTSAPFDVALKS